jgi:LPS-assembly protein
MGLTLGRVLRSEPLDEFAEGSGLQSAASDYVGAVSLDFDWGLQVVNRALFDTDLNFRRNELAFGYDGEFGLVNAAYIFLAEDDSNPALGDQPQTNEFSIDARYRVRPNWEIRGLWRYDVATNNNLRAGAGIAYGNECAEFDLSVSRRYTSSNNVPPSTTIRFGLRLAGIGDGQTRNWPERVCLTRGT